MPFSLHGIGVSRGYAIGRTYLLQRNQPEITEYTIPDAIVEDEVERFLNGLPRPGSSYRKSGRGFRRPHPAICRRFYRYPPA
jgi:phosphoenolpyruvate-protein kinase (PTS system EI component)